MPLFDTALIGRTVKSAIGSKDHASYGVGAIVASLEAVECGQNPASALWRQLEHGSIIVCASHVGGAVEIAAAIHDQASRGVGTVRSAEGVQDGHGLTRMAELASETTTTKASAVEKRGTTLRLSMKDLPLSRTHCGTYLTRGQQQFEITQVVGRVGGVVEFEQANA